MSRIRLTSSSDDESSNSSCSGNLVGGGGAGGRAVWTVSEEVLFPAMRASNLASFVGRGGLEEREFEGSCKAMSSDMVDRTKKTRTSDRKAITKQTYEPWES